jgi:threonine/homoserine/homoserine lactone efflux protein
VRFDEAIAFLLFAVVSAITPGPSNLILTSTAAAVGVLRGLPALFGQTLGMAFMLFATGFGLGSFLLRSSLALQVLKWCGIGFLLWLSFKLATAGRHGETTQTVHIGFWQAAGFQWINPKAWLICAAAVTAYMPAATHGALARSLWIAGTVLPCCSTELFALARGWRNRASRTSYEESLDHLQPDDGGVARRIHRVAHQIGGFRQAASDRRHPQKVAVSFLKLRISRTRLRTAHATFARTCLGCRPTENRRRYMLHGC